MAISIGVLVYFLVTTDGIAAFAGIVDSIQVPWFVLIFVAVVVGWLLEALVLHFFCKKVWKYFKRYYIMVKEFSSPAAIPFWIHFQNAD